MHSVMHTLGKYRADTAAARCAVCGAAARRVRVVARGVGRGACRLFGWA